MICPAVVMSAFAKRLYNVKELVEMSAKRVYDDASNGTFESLDDKAEARWAKVFTVEWLGQTAASLCWIASVFTYGIGTVGDWLQLLAASAWFVANVASILNTPAS